jgi:pre-mRNA-processing factor SLU7
MTHKAKDCVERPRAKGAKLTGSDIAPDEKVQTVDLDYEGKHDRYNGYDSSQYARVVERYEAIEALKQQRLKERELARTFRREQKARLRAEGGAVSSDSDSDADAAADDVEGLDDEEKLADAAAAEFGQVTRRVRSAGGGASSSVRNLRIREDTAKYLLNLDTESAHYDPKTRSMREDPTPNADPGHHSFRGDNAYRRTGDAAALTDLHVHAWEAEAHGQEVHLQAAPSAAEALFRQFKAKKDALTSQTKQAVRDKYGDAAAASDPSLMPPELLMGQSETYAEYDATGRLVKGVEKPVARSRWEEDVFVGNHTKVWGSWWQGGSWGYACCHSQVKHSYCTGAAGIEASQEAGQLMAHNVAAAARAAAATAAAAAATADGTAAAPFGQKSVTWGSDVPAELQLDPKKLAAALARQEMELRGDGAGGQGDERKRGYNSLGEAAVTEEDMEAWRQKRQRGEDPVAAPGTGGTGTDGYEYV